MLPTRTVLALAAGLFAGAVGLSARPTDDPPPPARPAARPAPAWVETAKLARPEPVERVAYGPKGVGVADRSGNLVHWTPGAAGDPTVVLKGGPGAGHVRSVERLRFTPDGKWLYAIADGGRMLFRCNGADMSGGHGIRGEDGHMHDLAPDGRTWLDWFDSAPKGIHVRPNGWERHPPGTAALDGVEFDGDVKRGVMSPDNAWLAVALANGTVQMVEWDGLKKGTILPVTAGPATDLVFSPDSGRLAVVEPGGSVTLFAHGTGVKLATLAGHEGGTAAVCFHPEGKVVATAGADKAVRLWDAATGRPGAVLRGHTDAVTGVAFSPDGQRLASGSADKTARVWEFRP